MKSYALAQGDVLQVLKTLPDNSFDALLTDPPYGIRFMGKRWDYDVPSVEVWAECLRVLKPGAPLLSFGGSRTFHRIVCNIEHAGFEICDTIPWLYGQGMPKPATTTDKYLDKHLGVERPVIGSRMLTGNAAVSTKEKGGTYGIQVGTVPAKEVAVTSPGSEIALQWEGYGHALRPSHEDICLACKPFDGTIAENILAHGVGGLNVRACRIGTEGGTRKVDPDRYKTLGNSLEGSRDGSLNGGVKESTGEGRWPANVILSHSPDCQEVGVREVRSGTAVKRNGVHTDGPVALGGLGNYAPGTPDSGYAKGGKETIPVWACVPWCPIGEMEHQAEGSSRFFYHAKVNRKERDLGCEGLPKRSAAECTDREEGSAGSNRPQVGAGRGSGAHNFHPTLKPIDLTRYLATLLLPPNPDATLLVPFAGAGSEMIGAFLAGWPSVFGIEREADYLPIIRARLPAWAPEVSEIR